MGPLKWLMQKKAYWIEQNIRITNFGNISIDSDVVIYSNFNMHHNISKVE